MSEERAAEVRCVNCGRLIVFTGVPRAWRVSAADPDVLRVYDTALCDKAADGVHRSIDPAKWRALQARAARFYKVEP